MDLNHMRLVLTGFGLGLLLIAGLAAIAILPKRLRGLLLGLAAIDLAWFVAIVLDYPNGTDFWGWFLDSSAEHTGIAISMSVQLMVVGAIALMLAWRGSAIWGWWRIYWIILTVLFIFLSTDEFYSIHESYRHWRQTYMVLGGGVVASSLIVFWRSDRTEKGFVALFIVGFGLMGVGGVFLDAFSNQHTIGPISLTCASDGFLGVECERYGMLEEYFELLGATLMLVGLLGTMNKRVQPDSIVFPRRVVIGVGATWLFVLLGSNWLFPTVEGYLFASPLRADYLGGQLSLVRGRFSNEAIKPGDTLDVTLYLRANDFLSKDYWMSVTLLTRDPANVYSISHDDLELGEFGYPTNGWLPGLLVRNRFHLRIPDDAPTPASYQLTVSIWYEHFSNGLVVERHENLTLFDDTRLVIADIPVLSGEAIPLPPTVADYRFEGDFQMTGYELPRDMEIGEAVELRFWWSADADVDQYWTQFLHFFNVETGEAFPFNRQPFGATFPTGTWPKGMSAVDVWPITLPDDMPPGVYRVQTGMFDLLSGERATVTDVDGEAVPDMSIIIGTVEVHRP